MEDSMGYLINQTGRKIVQLLMGRLKEHDITPEQWTVLYRVCMEDSMNQKEIAARTAKDQPTTARILDVLLRKGLVEKQVSPLDRRAFLVQATEKGKALIQQTEPIEVRTIGEVLAGLDAAQTELFRKTLAQINDNLDSLLQDEIGE